MQLKFSHVDILVKDLEASANYYKKVLSCTASTVHDWNREGFHVRYVLMFNGAERFCLVQPIAGNLKTMLDEKGEGTIYRLCYTVPNMDSTYKELVGQGIQPENENGEPLSLDNLNTPDGSRIIWLPKAFGTLSIELLEEAGFEAQIEKARVSAS